MLISFTKGELGAVVNNRNFYFVKNTTGGLKVGVGSEPALGGRFACNVKKGIVSSLLITRAVDTDKTVFQKVRIAFQVCL